MANLTSGNLVRFVDLSEIGGTVVTNDLDVDSSGNWFITDNLGGRVIQVCKYKILKMIKI